jgi:hypothetical protein
VAGLCGDAGSAARPCAAPVVRQREPSVAPRPQRGDPGAAVWTWDIGRSVVRLKRGSARGPACSVCGALNTPAPRYIRLAPIRYWANESVHGRRKRHGVPFERLVGPFLAASVPTYRPQSLRAMLQVDFR